MIHFNAKLGVFIKGIIYPRNVEGFEVNLKSIDNTTLYSEMTDAVQGFYLGPFENGEYLFDKYRIEIIKPNYLFKLLNKKLEKNGYYVLEYSAEKLGAINIIVHEPLKLKNLENVLVSLSSSNKLYRKIIKTDANGRAGFDDLEADLYFLLLIMQEYEFKPNPQVINITSGFVYVVGIDAKRVAFSCFGSVNTINNLTVGSVIIQANGIDDGNIKLNCKQSQENTKSDNETGIYRIRGLKPNCKYEISVRPSTNSDTNDYLYQIIPQHHIIQIRENDILDKNFRLINNLTLKSEIILKTNLISSKRIDFNARSVQKVYKNKVI